VRVSGLRYSFSMIYGKKNGALVKKFSLSIGGMEIKLPD
jgi:hypothetical protein